MDRGQPEIAAPEATPVPLPSRSFIDRFFDHVERIGTLHGWELFGHAVALTLMAWVPSMAIGIGVQLVFPDQIGTDIFTTPWRAITEVILGGPLLETLFMRYLFLILKKFTSKPLLLCDWSAIIWGLVHASYVGWGAHAVWPFFVLSICYLRLERISLWRAVWITTAIHGACNALSYLLYLATRE